jgi:uncharacterized Ntn-hydrolase superfamily protein
VPHWLLIVIAVLVVLAVGGALARRRMFARGEGAFDRELAKVNADLVAAAAQDRGWDRANLESAARRIYAEQRGAEPSALQLVEVRDRPGTDEDQAVFRAGQDARLTLGRRGDEWVLDTLE